MESGSLPIARRPAGPLLQGRAIAIDVVGNAYDEQRWRRDVDEARETSGPISRPAQEQTDPAERWNAALPHQRRRQRLGWNERSHGVQPRPRRDVEQDSAAERQQ